MSGCPRYGRCGPGCQDQHRGSSCSQQQVLKVRSQLNLVCKYSDMNQNEPSAEVVNQDSATSPEVVDTLLVPAPGLDNITPKSGAEMVARFDKIYHDAPVEFLNALDGVSDATIDLTETEEVDAMLTRMPKISDFVTEATVSVRVEAPDDVVDISADDDTLLHAGLETAAERVVTAAGLATAMSDMGLDDVDPNQDVSAELAALSEEDQQKMQSLREMSAAEGLPMTDAQLLTFLHRIKSLNDSVKKLKPTKRHVDHKAIAKRRAKAKAAAQSRKRNRGR